MWDGVTSMGSKRITKRHAMKGNGIEGKISQKGKSPNNFKAQVSNPKKFCQKGGSFKREPTQGGW